MKALHIPFQDRIQLHHHRNGVSGVGFHVALFRWGQETGRKMGRKMIAVAFDEAKGQRGHIAVFDLDEVMKGNLEFGRGNSWRGDDFEAAIRTWIEEWS